jgi:hypothetical protein
MNKRRRFVTWMPRNARAAALTLGVPPFLAVMALAAAPPTPKRAVVERVDFNRDVRPLLSENCFTCHGRDASRRQAGLRLDLPEEAAKKLASGRSAVVPGNVAASELIDRITTKTPRIMPPASTGKKLTPRQIAVLRAWVAQGAPYAPHWAYIALKRPTPPTPPADRAEAKVWAWARTPIDRFLLARLTQEGLRPSPAADRPALIRRVNLDLTGLPPTPQEVDAFVQDRSPNAYEKVVDRLLASPHYGERMAVSWLDLVRYADTVGYHGDQDLSIWPYRDYVINAFNSNKRFDVFTREQLAGDLLPHPTQEQRVASGYNRLGMMSTEGGIQDKEYRAKYAADRVRNASTVWLGATLGCAECHDHKYDPYAQKDFYRFAAFFADLKEKGFYDGGFPRGDWGPSLRLPTDAQKAELEKLDAGIATAKKALAAVSNDTLTAGWAKWEADVRALDANKALGWTVAKPTQAASSGGSTLTIGADGVILVSGALPAFDTYTVTVPATPGRIAALRLEALGDESLPGNGIARAGIYFVLSEFEVAVQRGSGVAQPVPLVSVAVNADDEGYPGLAAIDGRPDTGWGQRSGAANTAVFRLAEPLVGSADTRLIIRLRHETKPRLAIGKFRLSLTGVAQADLSPQGLPDPVLAALRKAPDQRTRAETDALTAAYRNVAPELEAARQRVAHLEADRLLLLGQIPQTQVSEAGEPRVIHVLPRGNWMDDSGEIVLPGAPHFLKQIARDGRATRLDLADWIVSPDNPLTARVFVNRLWKLLFGVGLAKNLDDFGAQSELPMHPDLLDWLASEFVDSGWDIKHMVRLMVTCSAYKQTATTTPALLAQDPYNRLYARQSAVRLDAEFVRDMALRVSGLLADRIGGPSVRPYQPRGYLAPLNFPRREWASDVGEDQYRRGLYTHWQRTFLHPSMVAFDAPSREEGTCTRAVSNTPMQALVLLNDPTFVEAARVFAERIARQGGRTFEQRVAFAYRTALSRAPRPEEVALLRRLYRSQYARYSADRTAAEKVIAAGEQPVAKGLDAVELAAWTSVARVLLNLHETITRS